MVSVGRAGVSGSLLRLFITAVLVLFPTRLLFLQNTQRVAKTITTASVHTVRYA